MCVAKSVSEISASQVKHLTRQDPVHRIVAGVVIGSKLIIIHGGELDAYLPAPLVEHHCTLFQKKCKEKIIF